MAKQKTNSLRRAMNGIGSFIFERGLEKNLDMTVTTCHIVGGMTITIYHPDGVTQFVVTDNDLAEYRASLTPRTRMARAVH